MRVINAIRVLEALDPQEEILIQFFTRKHLLEGYFDMLDDDELWHYTVRVFDKAPPTTEDFGIAETIDIASELLNSKEEV